ncbi:hypothetical protein [Clostridium sp.]|uniref:hypothetical protein n=1 Tax=Clostridium sp. TaxID=1506 RepID=UPI003217B599
MIKLYRERIIYNFIIEVGNLEVTKNQTIIRTIKMHSLKLVCSLNIQIEGEKLIKFYCKYLLE